MTRRYPRWYGNGFSFRNFLVWRVLKFFGISSPAVLALFAGLHFMGFKPAGFLTSGSSGDSPDPSQQIADKAQQFLKDRAKDRYKPEPRAIVYRGEPDERDAVPTRPEEGRVRPVQIADRPRSPSDVAPVRNNSNGARRPVREVDEFTPTPSPFDR